MLIFVNRLLLKYVYLQIVFYLNTYICKLHFAQMCIYTEGSFFLLKN